MIVGYNLSSCVKGRVNKCFILNPKKIGTDLSCRFQEKCKNAPLILKNDVTKLKTRLI